LNTITSNEFLTRSPAKHAFNASSVLIDRAARLPAIDHPLNDDLRRLRPISIFRHIARLNAAAGYDIESVTIVENGLAQPRCIEVKGVPADSQTFFWTKGEIDAAKIMRSWYYLYLVPIGAHGVPLIDQVHIICDPITNVLDAPHRWSVEPTELKCAAVRVD
jgi:hypothetical protein